MRSLLLSLVVLVAVFNPAMAGPREDILATYATQAKRADPAFAGFSAKRGEAFYLAERTGGEWSGVSSCTTCHTKDPTKVGRQPDTGKEVDAMAASVSSDRFMKPERTEKWFTRNCKGVLGRECTALEKGDFVTYILSK